MLDEISKDLLDIDDKTLMPTFVAIGVQTDENGTGKHSAIVIGINNSYYLFHFGGREVELASTNEISDKYYIKYINDIVDQEYVPSFFAHCKRILKSPSPHYGHVFRTAYYDYDGTLYTEDNITNFTTCVGFCINVLTLFVEAESYFHFDDWDSTEMAEFEAENISYFNWFYSRFKQYNPEVTEEQFKSVYKRITPSEYTASGYIPTLPIRKAAVDEIIDDIKEALVLKASVA